MIVSAKRLIFVLAALLTMSVSASAMSYEQARNEALFLTDKMAYELNLTDAQYEAAYEINLDYLMGVTSIDDVYGPFWERRNLDLSYILYNWQWDAYIAASYFYRPLYWRSGYWHFGIYARYPHRDYFYYGRPHFYATYRGGHSWHMNGGRSYYHGRSDHFRPALPRDRQHFGMRDGFNRGDYRNVRPGSSTRVTTGHSRMGRNDRNMPETRGNNRSYENNRNNNRGTFNGNRSYDNNRNGSGHFSGSRSSSDLPNRPSSEMNTTPNRSSSGVSTTPNRPSTSNFSGNRTSSTPSRTYGGSSSSTPSRSYGSSSSSVPSRSYGSSSSSTPSRSYGSSSSSTPSRSYGSSSSSTPSRSYGSSSSSTPSRSYGSSSSRSSSRSVGSSPFSSRSSSGSFSGGRSFGGSSSSSTRSVGGSGSSRSGGSSSAHGGHFSSGRR